MNIIIAGVNGAGKSSLCKKLKNKFPEFITTHFSNPKDMEDGKRQYFDFVAQMTNTNSYLFDRFHEGEWVYAPIFRNYTPDYLLDFENTLYQLDYVPFFVYVYAKIKDIAIRLKRRGNEDFVKPEHYEVERLNFDNFLTYQHLPYCTINTSRLYFGQAFKKVLANIHKYEAIRKLTTGWAKLPRGDVNASILYVVNDNDLSTKITGKNITGSKLWITVNKCVAEQISIIRPERVVVQK